MLVLIAVTTAVLFFVSVNQVLVRLWTRAASGGFAHGLPRRSSRCLTGKIQCRVSKHDGGSPWPDDEGSEACVLIHWWSLMRGSCDGSCAACSGHIPDRARTKIEIPWELFWTMTEVRALFVSDDGFRAWWDGPQGSSGIGV